MVQTWSKAVRGELISSEYPTKIRQLEKTFSFMLYNLLVFTADVLLSFFVFQSILSISKKMELLNKIRDYEDQASKEDYELYKELVGPQGADFGVRKLSLYIALGFILMAAAGQVVLNLLYLGL